ncbi:MAG: ABC transporter ATP-binding protein, partial [Oscillospiraceae bacterium]|nr:ABC transporter ATP-binding protein [Oscillospiraceae bacterium]
MSRPRRGPHGPGGGPPPMEKAKDFKGTIRKLLSYVKPFKAAIAAVMIFAVGSTIFNIAGPKVLSGATTEIFNGLVSKVSGGNGVDFDKIAQILLTVMGMYVLSGSFGFVQGWLMSGVSQKMTYRMRKEISEKIHRIPMKYYESNTHGEVLSRVTNDVDTLGMSLNQSITQLITSVTTIIGVLVMMLSISWILTLIALVILPLSTALVMLVVKKSQKYFKQQQEYLGHVNGQVEEVYGGHLVIKAFNREEKSLEEFERDNRILYRSAMLSQFLSGMM